MESESSSKDAAEIARLRRLLTMAGINPDAGPTAKLTARERRHELLQTWRMTRASKRALAAHYGITHTQVIRDINRATDEEIAESDPKSERLKAHLRAGAYMAMGGLAPAVARGDVGASRAYRQWQEHLARLDGLNAPLRIERLGEMAEMAQLLNVDRAELEEIFQQIVAEDQGGRRHLRAL